MHEYFYPDRNDKLTIMDIETYEPFSGYWDASEKFALANVVRSLKGKSRKRMIDVGAGEGRLTIAFASYFEEIIALEPDRQRALLAKNNLREADIHHVKVLEQDLMQYEGKNDSCDLILISHVFQHIEMTNVVKILERAYNLLREDGILIIMCSHSTKLSDYFSKSYQEDGDVRTVTISENEFNRLICNDRDILPIHHFTVRSLKKLLLNFCIEEVTVFHELFPKTVLDDYFDRDVVINKTWLRNVFGRDVLIVARKK